MIQLSCAQIARATGAEVVLEGPRAVSGEVVIDSRAVAPGGMFVAFPGERVDGNAYLASAASAVVGEGRRGRSAGGDPAGSAGGVRRGWAVQWSPVK